MAQFEDQEFNQGIEEIVEEIECILGDKEEQTESDQDPNVINETDNPDLVPDKADQGGRDSGLSRSSSSSSQDLHVSDNDANDDKESSQDSSLPPTMLALSHITRRMAQEIHASKVKIKKTDWETGKMKETIHGYAMAKLDRKFHMMSYKLTDVDVA